MNMPDSPGHGAAALTTKTLSRRITIANTALVCAMVVIAGAVTLGLLALMAKVELAVDEYEEVILLDRAADAVDRATLRLRLGAPEGEVLTDLADAEGRMNAFVRYQSGEELIEAAHQAKERDLATSVLADLDLAQAQLDQAASERYGVVARDALARAAAALEALAATTDVSEVRASAMSHARFTGFAVAGVAAAIVAATIALSLGTHRRLVRALGDLRRGARRIAAGQFSERLSEGGDREIAELAADFNQMAAELDTLYRVMEAKVEEKSRELVRSERLASVGFLAAGVAHEINNPLGIIAGYAELSRKWIAARPSEHQLHDARGALEVIREEAFRCKEIVGKLMTLSRPGDGTCEAVCMTEVARDVVSLVRGLERARSRRILFQPADGDATVAGNAAELRQVALNLLVNSVDATEPDVGEIQVRVEADGRLVRLAVSDNGRGMTEETRRNAFEPFFSGRTARAREPGMGLGLTISHAIVEAHGGRLRAESDGPGRGSRFVVELPLDHMEVSDDGD